MKSMDLYEKLRKVPEEAKKTIEAGRLKGFTDINPMWRIKALTEVFGPCGIGWWYRITDRWTEAHGNEIRAFVNIELFYVYDGKTSQPIAGTGGASFSTVESKGNLYVSDECFKMALTDAISVAAKAIGVGADVYYEKDRDKYTSAPEEATASKIEAKTEKAEPKKDPTAEDLICDICKAPIKQDEYNYSMRKHKRPLCRACQKKA